jgi:tetraacyldisaccharide 4'-kinase
VPGFLRFLSILFFPLVIVYTFLVYLRLKLYEWRWFKSCSVSGPVISVGNIQIGGTGKTPMVEFLAETILAQHRVPVIISRGYRRTTSDPVVIKPGESGDYTAEMIGDEPLMLSRNVKGAFIFIDNDRCRAAKEALSGNESSVIILDDGFQHRKINRDLNIVMIDVSRWSGLPFLFPLTTFRDVKSSLRFADCAILVHSSKLEEKKERLKNWVMTHYNIPVYFLRYKPQSIIHLLTGEQIRIESIISQKVACFCGIANPMQFYEMLQDIQLQIGWQKSYRDHHDYQESDLIFITNQAKKIDAQIIITTQKDAVKLEHYNKDELSNIYYLKIDCEIDPFDQFSQQLQKVFVPKK